MKVLFDTNIVMDLLLNRQPHAAASAAIMAKAENGALKGYLCATTITTVHYLTAKSIDKASARKLLWKLMSICEIAGVNRPVLESALASKVMDFEDAVLCEAARHAGSEAIVTRNIRDFRDAPLPVFEPRNFLRMLEARER